MKKFLSACLVMCGLAAMADTVVTVEAVEEIAIGGGGESAMTMALGMPTLWWSAPFAAVLALLMAAVFYKKMIAADEGSDQGHHDAEDLRDGCNFLLGKAHIPIERVAHHTHHNVTDPVSCDQKQYGERVPAIAVKEVRNRPNTNKAEPADHFSERMRK